jgi:hypothetical protein
MVEHYKHTRTSFYGPSFLFTIAFVLVLIAGFRKVGLDRDSISYSRFITGVSFDGFLSLFNKEPFFWLIVEASKLLFSDPVRGTFVVFAILGVLLKLYAIKKISPFPVLSVLVYICFYFILHEMTQIRVGVATAIFLIAIPDIANKNLRGFLLKTALATMFHYSSIIMVPLYFLTPKKHNKIFYMLLPYIGILFSATSIFSSHFNSVIPLLPDFIGYKINIYYELLRMGEMGGINVYNMLYSSLLVIHLFAMVNINRFKDPLVIISVKIFSWMLFLFYFFSFMPLLAFRFSEFFGVVLLLLLPSLIVIVRQKILTSVVVVYYSLLMLVNYLLIQKLLNI